MNHYLRQGDTIHTVTLEGSTATIAGRSYAVEVIRREGGLLNLRIDGRPVHVFVAADGNARIVQVEGGSAHTLERVDSPRLKKKRDRAASGSLTANTPAQVVRIEVAVGDEVTRGQTLVVLEAMKMEFKAAAPRDGVVEAVNCQVGEVVDRGRELLRLEALAE